jgi:hypothetical protein
VLAAAALPARADDWPDPAKWAGKYPHKGPTRRSFDELPSIRAALVQLVGEQFYRHVIMEWTEYFPIQVDGNTMLVEQCKPHGDCGDDHVTMVIQGRHMTVCAYHRFPPSVAGSDWLDERIWFFEGIGLPVVELNPRDAGGCLFDTVDEARAKLQHARPLAAE